MSNKTRINKWKNYREIILDNENLDLSIINSDPELIKSLQSINFDYHLLFNEKRNKKRKSDYYQELEESKKIHGIIEEIEKNENMKLVENKFKWDINTHEYDEYITKNFKDFEEVTNQEKQEEVATTSIKIRKLSI